MTEMRLVNRVTPEFSLLWAEQCAEIDAILGTITPREEFVLRLYYGMFDGTPHTLEFIGQVLGVTRERAKQSVGA